MASRFDQPPFPHVIVLVNGSVPIAGFTLVDDAVNTCDKWNYWSPGSYEVITEAQRWARARGDRPHA